MCRTLLFCSAVLTLLTASGAFAQADAWREHPRNPLFGQGRLDLFTGEAGPKAYYPSVLYDRAGFAAIGRRGPPYRMWYGTSGGRTALAVSQDGFHWQDRGVVMVRGYHATVKYFAEGFRGTASGEEPHQGRMFFRMWYWDPTLLYTVAAMRYAESPDGVHWYNDQPLQNGAVPIVTGAETDWNRGSYGPCDVLYDPDAANEGTEWTFALYYDGTTGGEEAIGLAYSADGVLWHGHDADGDGRADPVLEGTRVAGDWDYDYVSRATVIRSRAGYEMWYSGGTGAMNQGIGYARSADGVHWTRDSDNPILHVSDGVAWRSGRTYAPAVIRWSDGLYKM